MTDHDEKMRFADSIMPEIYKEAGPYSKFEAMQVAVDLTVLKRDAYWESKRANYFESGKWE